ncbi:MAG: hypothetical protein V3S37_02995 [Dehalococcoidia bacterium]
MMSRVDILPLEETMAFTKIHHVGLVTEDLEQARRVICMTNH